MASNIHKNGIGKKIPILVFKALFDEQSVIGTKTGLGMHLIRDLVKAIQGTISLHSETGKGTSITLHFKA